MFTGHHLVCQYCSLPAGTHFIILPVTQYCYLMNSITTVERSVARDDHLCYHSRSTIISLTNLILHVAIWVSSHRLNGRQKYWLYCFICYFCPPSNALSAVNHRLN